ncbi:hypothetical protein CRUP_000310 [Coryphaenoides rupestris]|nr:hypothetical protein CRUP_000310 [Coryphaenoides rupestris]
MSRGGARVLQPGERSTLEEKRRREEEERSKSLKGGKKVGGHTLFARPRPQDPGTSLPHLASPLKPPWPEGRARGGGRGRGASSSPLRLPRLHPFQTPHPPHLLFIILHILILQVTRSCPPDVRLSCPSLGRPAKQTPPPGPTLRKSNSGSRASSGTGAGP